VNGLVGVTGAKGTWSAGLVSGSILGLKAETPEEWSINAESDPVSGTGLTAGSTYTTSGSAPFLQAAVQGVAVCPSSTPRGTFRFDELTYPGSARFVSALPWPGSAVALCLSVGERDLW
jgi:hypothetical protein